MVGMLRSPPATARRKPASARRRPLGAAAAVGALLGIAVLLLTLSGVPALGWTLLGAVAAVALVDTTLTAAGRQSPSILERLVQRRPGG
jgi:hypothetical protein